MSELIRRAKEGDNDAMTEIINENVGLVWNIVKRFSNRGYEKEDLFQIGCLGFVKAIKRFDLNASNKLTTYAVTMIIGEIKRFLRDDGTIRVSRSLKENATKIREYIEYIKKITCEEPSIEQIINDLNISKEDIITSLEATSCVDSLDKTLSDDDNENSVYSVIPTDKNDYEKVINKITVESMLNTLDELEKKIIIKRYFEEMTQSSVATECGISQVQVSRIEKRALLKMRG